jgi:hypothetical protein
MTEEQCLSLMVSPGQVRPKVWSGGVLQIWVTRQCDKACYNCTQLSQLSGAKDRISVEQFEAALISLCGTATERGYFGVVGVFGGNPALHPQFDELCKLMQHYIPYERRGLWCNKPFGKGKVMRETFNPAVSNLNVHLDREAYDEFKASWPECMPFGLENDSRHSPPWVGMKDVGVPLDERYELISKCDVNQNWSAMIGVFRGQLRGYFCEIAGSAAMIHQNDPGLEDTGVAVVPGWWDKPMSVFAHQVKAHCHDCGVPLRGRGALACGGDGVEQVSAAHANIYTPKDRKRTVELVTDIHQLGSVNKMTDYLGNAKEAK